MELEMHNDAQPGDEDLLNAAAEVKRSFMVEQCTPLDREKCRMIHLFAADFVTNCASFERI